MPEVNGLGIFVQSTERKVVVSSRDVARVFEEEHYNVIRDIKNLGCSESFNALNFEAVEKVICSMNRLARFACGRSGYSRYWEGVRCA